MGKTALVAGGTGLIGRKLIELICENPDFGHVLHVGRRSSGLNHHKLSENLGADMSAADISGSGVDVAFCCLGTTMARAGSKEAFYAVDHDLCVSFGLLAQLHGATLMIMVSSLGADAGSGNYYLRVKGETERDLAALGFRRFVAVRPSLLLGPRSESRPGERAGQVLMGVLNPLFVGSLKRYKAITAGQVAQAMVILAGQDGNGVKVVENERLLAYAG
jgi:uncharacterized protein YbjT (DUF2867 family)